MNTKDVILELRTKKGLSQDELAEKVYVTRQAVSRWETGETVPNTETLKPICRCTARRPCAIPRSEAKSRNFFQGGNLS